MNYEQNGFEKLVTAVAVSVASPDVGAWKSCLSGKSLKACGAASLDLPWARVFKGLKVLKACNSFTPGTEVLMADGTTKPMTSHIWMAPKSRRSRVSSAHWVRRLMALVVTLGQTLTLWRTAFLRGSERALR
ncbi:hypothetical protein [Streptomyces iranensis]|uniref:Transposase IS4 family protein n=1 Tax=Streptomyces iranensis TaxID=576784 RepID=A0ABS4N2N0_9ACTN|nr:hypothetical protein [Streptomyces iranensis]MBP2066233.1 hypothetical protein [Streptomyces iranensis]